MVRVEHISFNRHLPNCICQKCGNERDNLKIGKKVNGMFIEAEVDLCSCIIYVTNDFNPNTMMVHEEFIIYNKDKKKELIRE